MASRSFGFPRPLLWRKRRAEKTRGWERKEGPCNFLYLLRGGEAELPQGQTARQLPTFLLVAYVMWPSLHKHHISICWLKFAGGLVNSSCCPILISAFLGSPTSCPSRSFILISFAAKASS